jgi:hypothetical protein
MSPPRTDKGSPNMSLAMLETTETGLIAAPSIRVRGTGSRIAQTVHHRAAQSIVLAWPFSGVRCRPWWLWPSARMDR